MSKVIKEFSRFAHQYDQHNMIQAEVAKTLVSKVPQGSYESIIDIGCGSGAVYANLKGADLSFDHLTVLDSSQNMLDIHPQNEKIQKICGDFNSDDFKHSLKQSKYDLLLSSSALQWSQDLDFTLSIIASLSDRAYLAIFISGTFKTLHKTAKVNSPIYSAKKLQESIVKQYADVHFELHNYRLHFESVREMFRYIKRSGVSSGEKKLSLKETKSLMKNYPLDYLEFEVLFAVGCVCP